MSISSWFRKHDSKAKRTLRFRPQLEELDSRLVPSTLHVTSSGDVGKGTLRYAIDHANNRDTIMFAPGIRTIMLHGNELVITTKNLTIKGPGADQLTVTTDYFSDSGPYGYYGERLFEVAAGSAATISGLTLTNGTGRAIGYAPSANDGEGGAILNFGKLTVSGCFINGNYAGIGGGIYNAGTLVVNNSRLVGDSADGSAYGLGGGGGIYNTGTMTVTGCVLSFDYFFGFNNLGGAIYNAGTASVGTSTFVRDDIYGPYTDLGGNTFITQQPQIGSFTASASTVTAGDGLTLTASNLTDANPNSSITQVLIYGPNSIGGTPFGYATQTSPGVWTFTFSTAGWAPGVDTFYAVAVDSYGVSSLSADVTIQVV